MRKCADSARPAKRIWPEILHSQPLIGRLPASDGLERHCGGASRYPVRRRAEPCGTLAGHDELSEVFRGYVVEVGDGKHAESCECFRGQIGLRAECGARGQYFVTVILTL
jgi:hypothetical protein